MTSPVSPRPTEPGAPPPARKDPSSREGGGFARWLPASRWLLHYQRADLPRDLVAGVVTAILLIPQSMAYAQLAGLPAQMGLYASVLPLAVYALLGTSRQLSVGPVAIASLMVATTVERFAPAGSTRYIELALVVALLVGALQVVLGMLRLGSLLKFISHSVLTAFSSASALIIAAGQLRHILGYRLHGERFHELIVAAITGLGQTNPVTLALGAGSLVLLVSFRKLLRGWLVRWGLAPGAVTLIVSAAPLLTVVLGIAIVGGARLDTSAGVGVVGEIPAGLSPLRVPTVALGDVGALFPGALAILLVGVVESIAVANTLAAKRRETIDPNQELVALGAANLAAGCCTGYPVTGGFARSVVNYQAGALTGLASLVTAAVIALVLVVLTPAFYFLPQAVLAATVIVAVFGLVDLREPFQVWRVSPVDAITWGVTFGAVLVFGVEVGIFTGVVTSALTFLWHKSRPHLAVVGRLGETETYRNVLRHEVRTCPQVLAVRVDASLYFGNAQYLRDALARIVEEHPQAKHLVLIGSAINSIDASALHALEHLLAQLGERGVELHLADVKGPVLDRLVHTPFFERLGRDHVHLSTHEAMRALGCV